jgi:Ca2+-binding RTX toxin-like protein
VTQIGGSDVDGALYSVGSDYAILSVPEAHQPGWDPIEADSSGRTYLTGLTRSTDWPTAGGPFQSALAGSDDAFVAILDPSGGALLESTYLGGSSNEFGGRDIAVDAHGSVWMAGMSARDGAPGSVDFPEVNAPSGSTCDGTLQATLVSFSGPHDLSSLTGSMCFGGAGGNDWAAQVIPGPRRFEATVSGGSTDGFAPVPDGALPFGGGGSEDGLVVGVAFPPSDPCTMAPTVAGLVGTVGDDVIHGTNGPDVIYGMGGNDVVCAKKGDDNVYTLGGDDLIGLGPGHDFADAGDGHNYVMGGTGVDDIRSGSGNDTLDGGTATSTLDAGEGNNWVYGSDGKDTIECGSGNDVVRMRGGTNVLNDAGGTNTVFGGPNKDTVITGSGDDTIDVGHGDNTVYAGEGENRVVGGDGRDQIDTGDGHDYIDAGGGRNRVYAHGGDDYITVTPDALVSDRDRLDGGAGSDTCLGGVVPPDTLVECE